ncbi:MAG: YedE family putative selenium transporter [Defluviitaleaceae bacterium]|nr:YedE family putative selenium transporter [Defluviitaleaceae bacterium]
MYEKIKMPLVGGLTAVISIVLVMFGNPGNMGFCIACFLRDTAGALGLHGAGAVQYARPEVIGIIFGAFAISMFRKEFAPKGGSAPLTRFVLGMCVMIGALIFLGCPLRMILRMAGGDLNALVGLVGFVGGILLGVFFVKKGYSLKRTHDLAKTDGFVLPIFSLLLLAALILYPSILIFSQEGPGAARAPLIIALAAGGIMGAAGFVSRICFSGGIRDSILLKHFSMLSGFIALLIVGIIGNIALGQFNLGFTGQPVAHTQWVWNILGLALVGFGSILLSGCPFRQMVLAGSGNTDSAITVFGMVFGAALAHNLGLASSAAGATANGKIGFGIAAAIALGIAAYNTFTRKASVNG